MTIDENSPTALMPDLRRNALSILVWTETLQQITDWDSPAAGAIRNYISVSLDYHSRVLDEPAKYLDAGGDANWRGFKTRLVVEAALTPEKFTEVTRRIDELWQQVGDKRER